MKILALDGGGVRGIFSAVILSKIEEIFKIKIKDYFDMFVGTSTGSILASSIALDIPLKEIIDLYEFNANKIFKKRFFAIGGYLKSQYRKEGLQLLLTEKFGDKKLGQIDKPLMIIATDMINGEVYVHKSNYLSQIEPYYRDKETKLVDAILSSCSAPTYFDPQRLDNGYLLCDGGLWANNPSLLGLTEAISKFKKELKNIFILSIGTGISKSSYKGKSAWGLFPGWGPKKIVDFMLNLSSLQATNMTKLILFDNYLRLDQAMGYNMGMDDVKNLPELKCLAKKCVIKNQTAIIQFLRGVKK